MARHGPARSESFRNLAHEQARKERNRRKSLKRLPRRLIFPELTVEQVRVEAVAWHNAGQTDKARRVVNFEPHYCAPGVSVLSEIDRVTVNYIRHRLLPYDEAVRAREHRNSEESNVRIKTEVYHAIIDRYPELKRACYRQMRRRGLVTG